VRPHATQCEHLTRCVASLSPSSSPVVASELAGLRRWFGIAHGMMARYRPGLDDVVAFEEGLLTGSLEALHECLTPTYIRVVAARDEG
jgi:hypothetical protein